MKYISRELIDDCSNYFDKDNKENQQLLENAIDAYWKEFQQNSSRFPSSFVKEYSKHAFHDNDILSFSVDKMIDRKGEVYSAELKMMDYYIEGRVITIKYTGISKIKTDFSVVAKGQNSVFLYSEILPINENTLSHEIMLGDNNTLLIEFQKIRVIISKDRND